MHTGTGAVEAEEEDEREQDGADDERRHGGGQAAAAALIGRRQRQGRGMLLLQLVPLLHAPLYWPLPPVLCSALFCLRSQRQRLHLQLGGGDGNGVITSALSYRKEGKQAVFFLSRAGRVQASSALLCNG